MSDGILWTPFKFVQNVPSPSSGEPARGALHVNNHFHVVKEVHEAEDEESTVIHLSIRRNDRAPVRDWRLFQRIKNELAGEDWEAIELYPRESRVVDTSNQYHLWCFPEEIGVGYNQRVVRGPGELSEDELEKVRATGVDPANGFQREFGQEHRAPGQGTCTACGAKYNPRTGCNCPPVEIVWEEG